MGNIFTKKVEKKDPNEHYLEELEKLQLQLDLVKASVREAKEEIKKDKSRKV
jgi:hypothetical protein